MSPTFTLRCKDLLDMHRKQVDGIVTATRDLAANGSIDPVDEMARDQVIFSKENNFQFSQVFIFQGHKDPIVPWSNAGLIHQFYSAFTQEQNIEEKSDLQATHGMVGSQSTKVALIYNTASPLPAIRLLWVLLRHALPLFLHQQLPLQRGSSRYPEGRL